MTQTKSPSLPSSLCKIAIFLLSLALMIALPYSCRAGQVQYDPWYYQDDNDPRFWLPDKYQHCAGSFLLTKLAGPEISIGAGLLKEIYDNDHAGGYSIRDLAANLAGVTAALVSSEKIIIFPLYNHSKKYILLFVTVRFSRPSGHVSACYHAPGPYYFGYPRLKKKTNIDLFRASLPWQSSRPLPVFFWPGKVNMFGQLFFLHYINIIHYSTPIEALHPKDHWKFEMRADFGATTINMKGHKKYHTASEAWEAAHRRLERQKRIMSKAS